MRFHHTEDRRRHSVVSSDAVGLKSSSSFHPLTPQMIATLEDTADSAGHMGTVQTQWQRDLQSRSTGGSLKRLFRTLQWKSRRLREKFMSNVTRLFRRLGWNRRLFRNLRWNFRTHCERRRPLTPEICHFRVARYDRNHTPENPTCRDVCSCSGIVISIDCDWTDSNRHSHSSKSVWFQHMSISYDQRLLVIEEELPMRHSWGALNVDPKVGHLAKIEIISVGLNLASFATKNNRTQPRGQPLCLLDDPLSS